MANTYPTSKPSIPVLLLCVASFFFMLSGCQFAFGLKPAGSAAVLSFSVSAPGLVSPDGRAVFTDGMTLYLRTIGGPDGDTGPLYGPYTLSGTEFSTTDLPAGSYDNLGIICFAEAPSPVIVDMLSKATDAELVADDKSGTSLATFDSLCDGKAITGMTGSLSLKSGNNSVSVTLRPLCGPGSTVSLITEATMMYGTFSVVPAAGETYRRFIRLDLSARSPLWTELSLACLAADSGTRLALYDGNGKPLTCLTVSPMDGLYAYSITKLTSSDELYLYIQTTASEVLSLTVTATNGIPNLVLNGEATYGNGLTVPLASGTTVNFTSVNPAYSRTITFYLENNGPVPLAVSAITLSSADGHWTCTPPALPVSVPAGDSSSVYFNVLCANSTGLIGTTTASVTVTSDDPDEPAYTLNLTASLAASS